MDTSSTETKAEAWPDRRLAWIALGLLMFGLVLAAVDRAIINLLVEPIKADYGLSDTQFGAVNGLAFAILYVGTAIPFGLLADRYQRRLVIFVGIGAFSLFSVATGFARNFVQLFIVRMGVGCGEASINPGGMSMISDYFPPERLGRAIGMFIMSNYIGVSLAMAGGGMLIEWLNSVHATDASAFHGFEPWQVTFLCVGLPGLLLAPCFLLLREPPRRGMAKTEQPVGFTEFLKQLGKRRKFFILLLIGMAMGNAMTQAVSMWVPSFFIRTYGWSVGQIGGWLGILLLLGGVSGSYIAGWLTDYLARNKSVDAPLNVAVVSFLIAGIFGVIAPLMPTPELSLAVFSIVIFLKPMAFAAVPAALQLVMPNQLRASVAGLYFTTMNMVGLGLGPIVIGFMSDVFSGPTGLRYAIVVFTAVTTPLMVIFVALARGPYRKLREELV